MSGVSTLSVFANGGGDINGDTLHNGADVQGFIHAILGGPANAGRCAADMDADGDVDANDLGDFVDLLLEG